MSDRRRQALRGGSHTWVAGQRGAIQASKGTNLPSKIGNAFKLRNIHPLGFSCILQMYLIIMLHLSIFKKILVLMACKMFKLRSN